MAFRLAYLNLFLAYYKDQDEDHAHFYYLLNDDRQSK